MSPLPDAKTVRANPSAAELKDLAAAMPNARRTRYGSLNVHTRVLARSKASTFILVDDPAESSQQAISREEGDRIAELQDDYVAGRDTLIVDGYIGDDPEYRTAARLYVEESNANIAAMQKQLYFEVYPDDGFEPELTAIYTPNLAVEGYPNDRVITVDLERGVTRVCNSDYFGESKKAGLRMWNKLVFDRGGLPLHAGCKVIPTGSGDKVGLIVGLSGTGKTTTTFTNQNGSPARSGRLRGHDAGGGKVYATEAGCFAKTFALSPEHELTIHGAVIKPEAYLENVSQDESGEVDFFDESYTQNGRATFSFSAIEAAPARDLEGADFLLILNRNETSSRPSRSSTRARPRPTSCSARPRGRAPGAPRSPPRACGCPAPTPSGPTTTTSRKRLPRAHGRARARRLPAEHRQRRRSPRRRALPSGPHPALLGAIVKGIAEGTIGWQRDPDFGYQVATHVPGIEAADEAVLRPPSSTRHRVAPPSTSASSSV